MELAKYQFNLRAEGAIAIGVAFGILTYLSWWGLSVCLGFFFLKRSTAISLLLGAVLGVVSSYIHSNQIDSLKNNWIDHPQKIKLTVKISDTRCSHLYGIKNPYWLDAKLLPPESGTLKIHVDEDLKFGDVGRIYGTLTPKGDRHFRYFFVDDWKPLGKAPPEFRSYILSLRDKVLSWLLAEVNNITVRQLAAKMFFGAGTGANNEIRRSFVNAGIVHLFSISGMHVALLSGVILLIFRIIPFSYRYFAVVICVTCYVLLSGASPPAVRAGFMISIWCILRSFLYYTPSENLLWIAAVAVLLNEPHLLYEPGVQFSFIITGALLIACSRWREFRKKFSIVLKLMPSGAKYTRQQERKINRVQILFFSLFTCTIAFLGGAAISLSHMDLFLPGSIIANLIITPFLPLFFLVMGLKILAHPLGNNADIFFGKLLDYLFRTLQDVAETANQWLTPFGAVRLSQIEVVIFIALLFITLSAKSKRKFIFLGLLTFIMIISWPIRAKFAKPEFVVVSGDISRGTQFAITYPESLRAVIINTAYSAGNRKLVDYLRSRGIQHVELFLANSGRASRRGVEQIKKQIKVRHVFAGYANPKRFRLTSVPTAPVSRNTSCRIEVKPNELIIKFIRYAQPLETWRILTTDEGEMVYGPKTKKLIPWSKTPQIYKF